MVMQADSSVAQAQIHQLFEDMKTAIQDRDLDKLMHCYDADIVSFDMIPPLQYNGVEAYRKNWQMGFDCMSGPIGFEMRDLEISIGDEVAFAHALSHLSGADTDGRPFENWVRWTSCLRKIDGQWRISHEHISVPVDMQTGRALTDLKP